MCGRTAQTRQAVRAAATALGAPEPREHAHVPDRASEDIHTGPHFRWSDNYNLSPGMDAMVFWRNEKGDIESSLKTWGLVTRNGTAIKPIPKGMSKHFEGLMFNARSDTLWDKPTFTGLLHKQRACIVAVNGFFEWKSVLGKKQPYFVSPKGGRPYLLMIGLWTTVQTGQSDEPSLDTFTVLTTEVCNSLKWLHTRMPVLVRNEEMAKEWLSSPSRKLHKVLVDHAQSTSEDDIQWHAVTAQMSSIKYRDPKAIDSIPKTKSVTEFFSLGIKNTTTAPKTSHVSSKSTSPIKVMDSLKRATPFITVSTSISTSSATIPSPAKKPKSCTPKKGSIESFFSPSKSK